MKKNTPKFGHQRSMSQADCDCANTLREYEAAHKVWMNTSVFTEAGKEAKRIKDEARVKYDAAYQAAHSTNPKWETATYDIEFGSMKCFNIGPAPIKKQE